MRSRNILSFITVLIILSLMACGTQNNEKQKKRKVTSEDLISINRYLVGQDAAAIKDYIEQNKLEMTETQTGLWYHVDKEGTGKLACKGDIAEIAYNISLLDGTLCYSSDSLGNKSFKIGQGGVESGLEEGILLLKQGSIATFIMPPHRAYGLVGDDNKVPGRSTLLYQVELISLKNEN